MNEDMLNMEVRKFLKTVGIGSQREIEHAVWKAAENGRLEGLKVLDVTMTLSVPSLGIDHRIEGKIALE